MKIIPYFEDLTNFSRPGKTLEHEKADCYISRSMFMTGTGGSGSLFTGVDVTLIAQRFATFFAGADANNVIHW